ncbi:uncharacterized protein BDR25DRAFT_303960 [Lindgomyces ingoldianus]|uniref:Uncharacterized protein n=1 Tax=Lindgomyces ingoldianus TaxID=673940 RepID=A0ACB6QW60_9PLEO|nr:uncharacterized protein BDR25DRAFT_303960 [Lindgomyces ingoldianus]KAF2470517.1 hypothetical protein BDR25DRAFT_303960 [Lindgomyces ingoldianus]
MDSLLPTSYDLTTLYKIEHAGKVNQPVFQVVSGFFCALAILAFIGRLAVRLTIRQRLYADDYLLIFSVAALIAATIILYKFNHLIYILNALKFDFFLPTKDDFKAIGGAQGINYSLIAMMWTATCAVKLCFLVSSKALIANVSTKITLWYWVTVVLVVISWGLAVTIAFIICPYTGNAIITHCSPETPFVKTMVLKIVVTSLDAITDIMIVAIPIWILHNVRIKLTQKFAIGVFLCLSVVMVAITITRTAVAYHNNRWDMTWEYLILYLESCIAIIMASATAFRTVFVEHRRRREQDRLPLRDLPQQPQNLRGRIGRMRARAKENEDFDETVEGDATYLPRSRSEGGKINGLLTFINSYGSRSRTENSHSEMNSSGFQGLGSINTAEGTTHSPQKSFDAGTHASSDRV